MNKHYDAALLGIWWGSNYGSCLNGYAVYKTLKALGKSVLLVNKHNASQNDWELADTHNGRFMRKFYPPEEVSPVIPFRRLHELNDVVDTFITGSDQIWNYNINRSFDMVFLQNFVADNKRKISFATSFGHDFDKTPLKILPESVRLMNRYNAISVREKSGVEICKTTYGVKAQVVVEPVFCLEKQEYLDLAAHSKIEEEGPYILTYILDPTPEKRRAIEFYCKASGLRALNVLDGNHANYERNKNNLGLPVMGKIGAEDLMKLYINAAFVISDSFHGTAFSIIFNKPFLSITNKGRGAARFGELLSKFGLIYRLVSSQKSIPEDPKFFEQIDYKPVNEIIKNERERSVEWLRNALDTPIDKLPSVRLADKAVTSKLNMNMCVGCGACVSVCPKDALELKPDVAGFYRSSINYGKCINCGKCADVCPALELPGNPNTEQSECLELVSRDEQILRESSSGGVFTALAKKVIDNGGVVVGAAWNDDLTVSHIMIDRHEDIHKLRKSKYLQSHMGDIFRQVKEKLGQNVQVLFTGCPCQVAGLSSYLKKDYPNLITVDLMCSYAPPASFFKKYVEEQFGDNISAYEFRHKTRDWNWDCTTVKITDNNDKNIVRHGANEDPYQKAYHSHLMTGIHCEKCNFQNSVRYGDITLGDFWGIGSKDRSIETKKGVSAVLCNNEKGRSFFASLDPSGFYVRKTAPSSWIGNNGFMVKGHNYASEKRDAFYEYMETMSFSEALNKVTDEQQNYTDKLNPLQFSSRTTHFVFDHNVWEEHTVRGYTVLTVDQGKARPGRYAYLPFAKPLIKGKNYVFKIRFRMKTASNYINFHIMDQRTNRYQIVHTYKLFSDTDNFVEVTKEFTANDDNYNSFMIGATQVIGEDNFFMLDSINIIEK